MGFSLRTKWSSTSLSRRGLLLLGVLVSAWYHRASKLFPALGLSVGFHISCRGHVSDHLFPHTWDLLMTSYVSRYFLFFFRSLVFFFSHLLPVFNLSFYSFH